MKVCDAHIIELNSLKNVYLSALFTSALHNNKGRSR